MASLNEEQRPSSLVWLGGPSDKPSPNLLITHEFRSVKDLEEFLTNQPDNSIGLVVSGSIDMDTVALAALPQLVGVYNENSPSLSAFVRPPPAPTKVETKTPSRFSAFVRKYWFLLGLILVIILAYFFPNVGKTGGYIRSEWSVKYGCVMFIFLLSGLSLRTRQLVNEILHFRLHLFVQLYSLLFMPFAIYGLCLLLMRFSMNTTLLVGLIILGCTSTTISSNVVMTKNALGNEYAALVNAVVGNLLGIFVSPALIFYLLRNPIFGSLANTNETEGALDYANVIKKLVLTVLIPLAIGQVIHLIWTKKVMELREKLYFPELNSLALLTLVWAVFCTSFATGTFRSIGQKDLLILIVVNAAIYVSFSLLIMAVARLPIPHWQFTQSDTVAMMFCGATKTLAMGIPLINALYGSQRRDMSGVLSLPLIIYHVEQLILGAFEVILLKGWVRRAQKKKKEKERGAELVPLNKV